MEYVKAIIGQREMYIPVNEKLGRMIILADKRLNHKRYIARRHNLYKGEIERNAIRISSNLIFELEDVREEQYYYNVFHLQITEYSKEKSRFYQELFREDKPFHFFVFVRGYEQKKVEKLIRDFFENLKKNYLRRNLYETI